ncbi:MAG TPA: histidine--tRNA ligase [Thermomicrobiales bacterium]|nr:histidine--tRNA ligase [Thermomicrobiales bacterium]
MAKQDARILKGFRDYLPDDMILRQKLTEIFRGVFEKHGFEPIDTPTLEYLDVLTGKAGENETLMYHFEDHGGRKVGLRYDLTVPLARFIAMHENEVVLPFKRYHIAPVWRAEKPQRGRFREFIQCDADIVGSSSMLADAEGISVLADAIYAVGLPQAVISINHRKLLEAVARLAGVPAEHAGGVFRAVDKLDKIGPEGVRAELVRIGVIEAAADQVLALVAEQGEPDELLDNAGRRLADIDGGPQAVQDLRDLVRHLADLGVHRHSWKIDLSLARGIDYYTGPVCEARVESPRVGSIAGTGRYDGLVGNFLGRQIPATGISLGFERILEVVREHDLLDVPEAIADAFMVYLPECIGEASRIVRELREEGLRIDQSIIDNKGIGAQLKYADRRGIPYAIIPGSEELDQGEVSLKNLRNGDQTRVAISVLAEELRHRYAEPAPDSGRKAGRT